MSRRAEGYVRKEITLSERALNSHEIWKCKECGRWHDFYESGSTEDGGVCDECWEEKHLEETLVRKG